MLNTTLHIPPEDDVVDHSAERVLIGILMACFIAICVTVLVLMGWWLRTVSLAERRRAVRRLSLGGHNPLQRRNSFDSTGSEAKVQFVTPFMPFRVNTRARASADFTQVFGTLDQNSALGADTPSSKNSTVPDTTVPVELRVETPSQCNDSEHSPDADITLQPPKAMKLPEALVLKPPGSDNLDLSTSLPDQLDVSEKSEKSDKKLDSSTKLSPVEVGLPAKQMSPRKAIQQQMSSMFPLKESMDGTEEEQQSYATEGTTSATSPITPCLVGSASVFTKKSGIPRHAGMEGSMASLGGERSTSIAGSQTGKSKRQSHMQSMLRLDANMIQEVKDYDTHALSNKLDAQSEGTPRKKN